MANSIRNGIIVFAAILGAVPAVGRAAGYTWTGQTGNWSDPANWAGGVVPVNDPATVVTMAGSQATQNLASTVDSGRPAWVLNGITFNRVSSLTTPDVLTIDAASALEFAGSGAFIEQDSSVPVSISGPIQLTNGLTVQGSGTGNVVLNGGISGNGGIAVTSSGGTLTLGGSNTFSGGVTIAPSSFRSTVVNVGQLAALGTGDLTIAHTGNFTPSITVTLQAGSGNTLTVPNNVVITDTAANQTLITLQAGNANQTMVIPHLFANGNAFFELNASTSSVQSLVLNGNISMTGTLNLGAISETSVSSLTLFGTAHLTGANSYSGGTIVQGTVYADAPGALGGGAVSVGNTLWLDATNAAQNSVSEPFGATINYAANGGASGNVISANGTVILGNSVTSLSNGVASDVFAIGSTGTIKGNSATLALLDAGVGGGTTPNFVGQAGASVENTDGGLPTIRNAGGNANLVAVVHTSSPLTFAVGAGTPWEGIAPGSTGFIGTLIANGDFVLGGVAGNMVGNGSAGSFNITAGGGAPVVVTVRGTTFNSPSSDYSGVSAFEVTGGLELKGANALGGGGGSAPVAVEIVQHAALVVDNSAALNGSVTMKGGTLTINAASLAGSGVISRDNEPITVNLNFATSLTGAQMGPSFLRAGDSVNLPVNNTVGVKSLDPGVNYFLRGNGAVQQAEGFNLNGGSLNFSNPYEALQAGPIAVGDSTIRVGTMGATIAASGTYSAGVSSFDSSIQVPLIAQGMVNFGYPVDPTEGFMAGTIVLTNASNQLNAVNVNNMTLVAASPAVLTGASITLNGGELVMVSNVSNSNLPPTVFNNPIRVAQDSVLADNTSGIFISSIFPPPNGNHAISLPSVSLGDANLTVGSKFGITINALLVTGNGTLVESPSSSGRGVVAINGVTQDGNTARSLSFEGSSTFSPFFQINGAISLTGPINVTGVGVEIDGAISHSTAALTVSNAGMLGGSGTIGRPIVFLDGGTSIFKNTLSPGGSISGGLFVGPMPGTLTFDSLILSSRTNLAWDLGTPNVVGGATNDLVAVQGDMTLDGALLINRGAGFGPGTYTLFTYGGALTDDGLTLPTVAGDSLALDLSTPGEVNLVVTAVPEAGTVGVLGAAVGMMVGVRRRRRG